MPQKPRATRCEEVSSPFYDEDHAENVSRTPHDSSHITGKPESCSTLAFWHL